MLIGLSAFAWSTTRHRVQVNHRRRYCLTSALWTTHPLYLRRAFVPPTAPRACPLATPSSIEQVFTGISLSRHPCAYTFRATSCHERQLFLVPSRKARGSLPSQKRPQMRLRRYVLVLGHSFRKTNAALIASAAPDMVLMTYANVSFSAETMAAFAAVGWQTRNVRKRLALHNSPSVAASSAACRSSAIRHLRPELSDLVSHCAAALR